MRLHIGLDARGLNTMFVRGMGEYIGSLIRNISPTRDVGWSLYGHRPDLPFHRPPEGNIEHVVLRDIPGFRFHTWEQAFLPFQAARHRLDLLHCTSTTLPLWQPVPTVVTIHDTIPWNTGEVMVPGFYRDWLLPRAYDKCAAIITISHHSRNDIVRRWPQLADKVRVIHHGVKAEYLACQPTPPSKAVRGFGVGRPYLLYLGGTTPRKRLAWTLDLFRRLDRTDIDLVVCGVAVADHETYRNTLPPEMRQHVVFLPFVAANDMPSLYQNAIAVLYPTLYEGFGLPAINAQAVGTPIVLSGVSSLLELVGPSSIPLPPDDTQAWIDACRRLVNTRKETTTPDQASRQWAQGFDWSVAAEAHWEVYQTIASNAAARQ